MQELEILKVDYDNALSVLSDDDYELHLQTKANWFAFYKQLFWMRYFSMGTNIDVRHLASYQSLYSSFTYVCLSF